MLIHNLLSFAGKVLARNKLSILIYHQVFAEKDAMRPSEPDLETFTWQMQLINKHFTPLSISTALKHLENGTLPPNAICVTFDDGYVNNLEVAAPLLKRLSIPATVYVATGFSYGENMWNDRLLDLVSNQELTELDLSLINETNRVLTHQQSRIDAAHFLINKIKYLPFKERKDLIDQLYKTHNIEENSARMMTPDQIKKLPEYGIEIGAHTVDHPILKVNDEAVQFLQMKTSKDALEEWLGRPVKGFAYPNGKYQTDYDENTRDLAKQAGFDYAVSTNWGVSDKQTDKWQLNRFTPWDTNSLKFHLRLIRNCLGF
jgi:peptidoglycan/xylan/chitin deacetylase (PgdA/CDA1 family)